MLRKLSPIILVLALVLTGCSEQSDYSDEFELSDEVTETSKRTLKFGRVPSVTVTELLRQNAPLIRLLKDELDVNITYRFAEDYRGIIEGMSSSDYDFTWMGPYSYVLSECYSDTSDGYVPLVRPMRRQPDGELSSNYRGIIFADSDSGIETITDVKGKSLAFVESRSTSGYLFPLSTLVDTGINPDTDLQQVDFLGRHDQVVRAVRKGEYDAGATYEDARMEEFDSIQKANEELPIIARTKPIPTSPITVSRSLKRNNPELVKQFINVMTSLHETPRGQEILKSLEIDRYRRANNDSYNEVRKVLSKISPQLEDTQSFCETSL